MSKQDILQNYDYYGSLFNVYGVLLTATQQKILNQYFNFNLSLREIADLEKISSTAVHDALQKGTSKLQYFESKLHLNHQRDMLKLLDQSIAKREIDFDEIRKELEKLSDV